MIEEGREAERASAWGLPQVLEGRRLRVVAVRDVGAGEELLLSYVPWSMGREERAAVLRRHFHFDCRCPRCCCQPEGGEEEGGHGCGGLWVPDPPTSSTAQEGQAAAARRGGGRWCSLCRQREEGGGGGQRSSSQR